MNSKLAQLRGEIAQEFSEIEYAIRGFLALRLSEQSRPLKIYKEQFQRFEKFFSPGIQLNPKVLDNPDVKLMDSQLDVSEELKLVRCIDRLEEVTAQSEFSRAKRLSSLLKKIKNAATKRNLLTHSIWRERNRKVQFQNFPDYYKQKYLWIDKAGNRKSSVGMEEWSEQKVRGFLIHIRSLNEKLNKIFRS
jgi:hypothetical protein